MADRGVIDAGIDRNPIAVIDVETTGLSAVNDRVVEVSVVKLEPGNPPFVAFDTLVNPCGPVSATWVHGITDEDVAHAPTFGAMASQLQCALSGCVVAGWNVYFDIRFLLAEFARAGQALNLPHFCIMYLRCMLGMGRRCSLHEACLSHGLHPEFSHASAPDAILAAQILSMCIERLKKNGLRTYGDIAGASYYKFCESFVYPPLSPPLSRGPWREVALRPRSKDRYRAAELPGTDWQGRAQLYREAVFAVLSDLVLCPT